MSTSSQPGRTASRADLPFFVARERRAGSGEYRVIAAVASSGLAYAAYYEAIREDPDCGVVLTRDNRTLARRQARREKPPLGQTAGYRLDVDLRFLSANPTALALWNRTLGEILGKPLAEAFPAALGSESYAAHLAALESRCPFDGTLISPILHRPIRLEIVPVNGGLAVSFSPQLEDLHAA